MKTLIIKLGRAGKRNSVARTLLQKDTITLWPVNKRYTKSLEQKNLLEAMISSFYFVSRTNKLIHKL